MRVYRFKDAPRRSSLMGTTIVLSTVVLLSVSFALSALEGGLELAVIAGLLCLAIMNRYVYAIQAVPYAALHHIAGFPNGMWGFLWF